MKMLYKLTISDERNTIVDQEDISDQLPIYLATGLARAWTPENLEEFVEFIFGVDSIDKLRLWLDYLVEGIISDRIRHSIIDYSARLWDLPQSTAGILHTHIQTQVHIFISLDLKGPSTKRLYASRKNKENTASVIDDIQSLGVSFLDIIESYGIEVKGSMVRCPFHQDQNPSMSVNIDKGLFYCFACMAKGNIISFVDAMEEIKSA